MGVAVREKGSLMKGSPMEILKKQHSFRAIIYRAHKQIKQSQGVEDSVSDLQGLLQRAITQTMDVNRLQS